MAHGDFQFVGKGGSFFWLSLWTTLLVIFTFGIFFPWAYCIKRKWIVAHTTIDGKVLTFKGTGGGLFGLWFIIYILSLITLGIYIPWGYCRFQRWYTNNLYYADTGDNESTS